jgi:peptidoglycan hydrolase CwlO-like protein
MKKLYLLLFLIVLVIMDKNAHASFLHIGGPEDEGSETTTNDDKNDEEEEKKKEEEIDDLMEEIEKYEKKLSDLSKEEKTLSNQIEYYDSQIKLTQLQIENTLAQIQQKERQIERIGTDIEDIKTRISRLKDSISYQNVVLNERMRERYKSTDSSPFFVLFGGDSVSTLIKKTKYLQTMELEDTRLLAEMKRTRENFIFQKDLFEEKKRQAEELKAEIEKEKVKQEQYNADLEKQKQEQKALLELTKQNEAKYQRLLDDARRELEQITGAASVLKGTAPRKVEKGEVIGVQGNTGYSFGDHLHFGVYKYDSFEEIDGWNWYYSNLVDPKKKLKEKSVRWNTGCESSETREVGDGDWSWPMSSPVVSQGFGHTCYSDSYYGGKPHPAYDMYGPAGSYVYAAEEGDAFFCRNCLGDGGNGVFIFHPEGYMSLYWHLK